MKNKNMWRKISSGVLTFTLAILIFGVNVIIGLNLGVFHNGTIEDSIRESKYYEESYEQLKGQIQELVSETDIPPEVIYEVVSLQHFYIDTRTYLQQVLDGNGSNSLESMPIAIKVDDISAAIRPFYEGKTITSNSDQLTTIEALSKKVVELYQEQMKFNLAEKIVGYRNRFASFSVLVLIAILVVGAITITALSKMYQKKYHVLRFVAFSVMGATGMMLVFAFMLSQRIDYETIIPEPVFYQSFIEIYSSESVKALIYPVAIGLIFFNVLLVMIKEMRRKTIGQ